MKLNQPKLIMLPVILLAATGCSADAPDSAALNKSVAVPADGPSLSNTFIHNDRRLGVDPTLKAMGPDGWHRIALFGNWDDVDPDAWIWIASQPDCDRATALAIFWKAEPEYYLRYDRLSQARTGEEQDMFKLLTLIRDRWKTGGYTRGELAFDPDRDAWPIDFARLRAQYGGKVDRDLPVAMRVPLPGRRLADDGPPLPGNFHNSSGSPSSPS